jgi:hypothetical protein
VKKGRTPFAKASGQTSGYRVYANRVYLADLRQTPFSTDEIAIASNLGIGLIQIKGRVCKEVLTSPYYHPITKLNLSLLEKIAVGKCQICGCFFEIGDYNKYRFSNLARENIKQAINKTKGLIYWNYEAASRKNKYTATSTNRTGYYERRFVCPECIEVLFAPLMEITGS